MISSLLKRLEVHLLNHQCTFCDKKISNSTLLVCDQCIKELPWCRQPGEALGEFAAFYYEAPIDQYILAGKTAKKLDKLHILGQLFNQCLKERRQDLPEALIPVPLHQKRLRERGFNQSLELARPISKQFSLPILSGYISRNRDTGEQKGLTETQRKQNMANAFSIRKSIPHQHIAILDDVITTGTTCATLRSALLEQGVKKVEIWCCATTKQ